MKAFPVLLDLKDRELLVVGGGRVAAGKLAKLLTYTDKITVAAADPSKEVEELCREHGLRLLRRDFREEDLEGIGLCVAAAGDRLVNREIADRCRARGILVNAADSGEDGSVLFPATVRRGSLTVSVATDGRSPALAAYLKERLAARLPEEELLEAVLERLAREKEEALAAGRSSEEKRAAYRRILEEMLPEP